MTAHRDTYGVRETNPLTMSGEEFQDYLQRVQDEPVDWTEPGLHITRIRFVTDPGFPMLDLSYCFGVLNGKPVRVQLPFSQLSKRTWKTAIVKYAIRDGVNAKRMGIFDNVSILWG